MGIEREFKTESPENIVESKEFYKTIPVCVSSNTRLEGQKPEFLEKGKKK